MCTANGTFAQMFNRTCGLFAAVILVAVFSFNALAEIPKKGAKPADPGKLVVVAEFPKTVEQKSDIKVALDAKGGKAPYVFTTPECSGCVTGEGSKQVFATTITADPGPVTFNVHVKDSSEKPLEADAEFKIQVNKHVTDLGDLRDSVDALTKAINERQIPNPNPTLKAIGEQLKTVVNNTAPNPQTFWGLSVLGWLVVLATLLLALIAVSSLGTAYLMKVLRRKAPVILACIGIALLLSAGAPMANAATPVVKSITPPSIPVGFAGDVKVCGTSVDKLDDVKFEGLVHKDMGSEGGCVVFTFEASAITTTGDYKLMVKLPSASDFTDSGKVLKVVEAKSSTNPPATEPTTTEPKPEAPKPTAPHVSSGNSADDMRWHARAIAVCGNTHPARCGREFDQKGITGDEWFKALKAAKTMPRETEIMEILFRAEQFQTAKRAVEDVFNDDRYKKAVDAMDALHAVVNAGLSNSGGLDDEAVRTIVNEQVKGQLDVRIHPIEEKVDNLSTDLNGVSTNVQSLSGNVDTLNQAVGSPDKNDRKAGLAKLRKLMDCAMARNKGVKLAGCEVTTNGLIRVGPVRVGPPSTQMQPRESRDAYGRPVTPPQPVNPPRVRMTPR